MRIPHDLPVGQVRRHVLDLDCPCEPERTVTVEPGKPPTFTVTHFPLPTPASEEHSDG